MKLLIDTNILIRMYTNVEKLSEAATKAIVDFHQSLHLSTISIWEIQLKQAIGKLDLGKPIDEILDEQIQINALNILPVTRKHAVNILNLPRNPNHRDPFDRMLISQAMVEDMTIVTVDERFSDYAVNILW